MKKIFTIFLSFVVMLSFSTLTNAAERKFIGTSDVHFKIFSPSFPDAYIITERTSPAEIMNSKATYNERMGLLNSVSATVFVEETCTIINNKPVITNSRLLSKNEVMKFGIDNFEDLDKITMRRGTSYNSRGKLTITLIGNHNTSRGVRCNLYGFAHWDSPVFFYDSENYCARGEDFIGVTWSGGFSIKEQSIYGVNHLGGRLDIYNADYIPNVGSVWSFKDAYGSTKYQLYAKDINLSMTIGKNKRTGKGNTAEAVLKYIHTYSAVNGAISISPSNGNIAGSFTLNNTDKQWSLVCVSTGIPY